MIGKKPRRVQRAGDAPVENAGNLLPKTGSESMYNEMKDGNGFVHRIANFDNPLICKRKGTIRIEAIKKSKLKQADVSFANVFDPKFRVWFGVPMGINENTGKFTWKRFYPGEFREYNLANENDAIEWAIISRHPIMKGARPLYKVYDVEADAKAEIEIIGLIDTAVGIAKNMKFKEWVDAARYFGKSVEGMSSLMLQSEIYKIARNTPKELVDYWENDNKELIDLFNAAKSTGLIAFDHNTGWMYERTLPLGPTEQSAIKYIKNDAVLSKAIQQKCKDRDKAVKAIMSKDNADGDGDDFDEESKDLIELRMKAQLLQIENYEAMEFDELRERVSEATASEKVTGGINF